MECCNLTLLSTENKTSKSSFETFKLSHFIGVIFLVDSDIFTFIEFSTNLGFTSVNSFFSNQFQLVIFKIPITKVVLSSSEFLVFV
jgi:hypothetical protein